MFRTYLYSIHTWFRLAVHRCDPERRAQVNKTCASSEEIDDWLSSNLFLSQGSIQSPIMDTYSKTKITKKYFKDNWYHHPINYNTV